MPHSKKNKICVHEPSWDKCSPCPFNDETFWNKEYDPYATSCRYFRSHFYCPYLNVMTKNRKKLRRLENHENKRSIWQKISGFIKQLTGI